MSKVAFRAALVALSVLGLVAADARGQATSTWGQKADAYSFGKPKKEPVKKLPKAVPGRVHLVDGNSRSVPLAYVDYNRIVAVENGAQTSYTPLEVSSFVIKQDSFVVLRDFNVAIGDDEQEYRKAFAQVGAVGPGFVLYHFKGTMQREVREYRAVPMTGPNMQSAQGMVAGDASAKHLMSKVWFVKLDNDPRWRSLPPSGPGLQAILGPLIADDKKLTRSIERKFLDADEAQGILFKYVANRSAALK